MPKRSPTLIERLRSVWEQASQARRSSVDASAPPFSPAHKGSEFAERLRAAVTSRH